MSILDTLITAIFNPARGFYGTAGSIAIQCTLEESHFDELQITDHPVEFGAMISDHSFKKPAEVIIRAGWSNAGLQSIITDISDTINLVSSLLEGASIPNAPFNYAEQVYDQLLTLQVSGQPFQIITGKRTYNNMLLRSLAVTTDEKTENALFVTAVCRQIIIAYTSTSIINQLNPANLNNPQANTPVQNQGAVNLTPAPNINKAYTATIPQFGASG